MIKLEKYNDVYNESVQNPENFWAQKAKLLTWFKPWQKVLDNNDEPFTKWFVGGKLNACYNAVDRHVENGKGSNVALIHDNPIIGLSRKVTYLEIQKTVAKLAGVLSQYGVEKGDRVLIYMPLIPETVMAMLATVRLGAIHSVVFGGFAAGELCLRLQHAKPKIILTANCGIEPNKIVDYLEILDRALAVSDHKPSKCIVFQREEIQEAFLDPERDVDWNEALINAEPHPCVPVDANDPLYILYTSGTTGDPKGIERSTGGHLVALAWSMDAVYAMKENDVWWATSDFGWVVGHSYMCYAPLICGVTSIIYEGKPTTTPDPGQYFRVINEYKVNSLFTIPTAMRVLKQADPKGEYGSKYDISSLRQIWFGGEHCDLSTKMWTENIFDVSVLNHWWQTETGSPVAAMCLGLKNPCSPTKFCIGLPVPGHRVDILRKDGTLADRNELGRITVKLPLAPGPMSTLYNAPKRFVESYFKQFPGYYDTMDIGYIDDEGLIYITARSDDVINVAGHRLSTLALENVVLSHPNVANACVIGVPDPIKTEVPLCLYVRNELKRDEYQITQELIAKVRNVIGPVACFKLCASVRALPMTRSGKICRKSIADLSRNKLKKISATVVDSTVYDDIEVILRKMGFC
ncbi:unnamed protein product [Brassicogethes aeneus]|uniref:Acyl-CoA synthetase short-chain family member 3, mitochondrial n=1 Tax=Brassicogethes aeneus TaxID=1431903 RepID=A0A9P0FHS2_BRAAE|nr:unnamed protein product [Brassicogethes aeneus]